MFLGQVDIVPVVIAAAVQFLFGWLWYSPQVFGTAWMNGSNCRKEECACSWTHLVGGFAVSLLMAWVFASLLHRFNVNEAAAGAELGFYIWLGFGVTGLFSCYLWSKQSFTVFLINSGHKLISLLFLGAFLSVWK